MTEAERLVERLRELLANAGLPWRVNAGAIGVNPWIESSNGTKLDGEYRRGGCILNMVAHDERENDAALIVEAVNALPTLLARIAAMKSAIQHVLDMDEDYGGIGFDRTRDLLSKALGKGSE